MNVDIAIIGSGPAAGVAAKLLAVLSHRVALIAPAPSEELDPHIVIPDSALQTFQTIGLREAIVSAGRLVRSDEIYWTPEAGAEKPGRTAGVQIAEGALNRVLHASLEDEGVERIDIPAAAFIHDGPRVVGVALADGNGGKDQRVVRADHVLCAAPTLLPGPSRPRIIGHCDVVSTLFLEGIHEERFPAGHHFLETFPKGWAWALRQDPTHLQYTIFESEHLPTAGRDRDLEPWLHHSRLLTSSTRVGHRVQRRVCPTLPGTSGVPGLLPIGRAAYSVSPLSSLGTAFAIQTGFTAAAFVNTALQGLVDPERLHAWYVRELTLRALRTHALCTMACREPLAAFDTVYWRQRAADTWSDHAPPELVDAARRARHFLDLSRHEIPTTPFRRVDGIEETTHLFQRGPVVRDEPAMVAAGGLPVAREEWDRMESLVDAFARPNTLAPVLSDRLGARLADPTADLERKQIAQDVGRLYEAGILEPADT